MRLQAAIGGLIFLILSLPAQAKFRPDPLYKEADNLLRQSKFVKAREIGERMLRAKPNSYEAQTILGRVHLFGEGNPGKADYYLRKAHKSIVKSYAQPNTADAPWECYADGLWALRLAAMDLEQYEQAMDWLGEYDDHYPPARPHLYGWPLMKLERMDEARTKMDEALLEVKKKPDAVNTILNTMGSVEYEAGNFEESLAKFEEIIARVERGAGETDAVFYSNAAEVARDLLDFPASEKHLLKSGQHLGPYSYSTPWLDLAELYIAQGRQPEALQALKRHSRHLASCEAGVQNQKRALSQRVLGMTLMACGYDLEASDLLKNVALHGDRNSGTSTKRSLIRSRNHFFYREALKQKRARLAELRSYQPLTEWPTLYWQEIAIGHEMEAARRESAALALKESELEELLRPYGPSSLNCPWLAPAISEIFGAGIVSVEGHETLDKLPEAAQPYTKAIIAEANGDEELMQEALDALPPSQVLVRGRLHAILGQKKKSAQSLQQAMEADPPVFRRLEMSLPVDIECSDSTLKGMIKASPRFRSGKGFLLSVDGSTKKGFNGHLQGPDGSVLCRFYSKPGVDTTESRQLLCEELHQRVFAPRVNLSQSDINSLDGSNLAGGHFREQLQGLMGPKSDSNKPEG